MSKIVKQGQSFLDKTTQLTGSAENALAMAILNNKSITTDLNIAEEIVSTPVINKTVVSFFSANSEPSTAVTKQQLVDIEELGIGKMKIGDTFIVR